MQEMNLKIVNDYLLSIRQSKKSSLFFYCCNRVKKTLPDGEVVNFSEYGWLEKDEVLFDELCPWHKKYYKARPPFYFSYDGPIKHKLVKFIK